MDVNGKRRWFVCPFVRFWSDMEMQYAGRRIPFSIDDSGVGFLEVYDSLESFNKEYPDVKPWIMTTESTNQLDETP